MTRFRSSLRTLGFAVAVVALPIPLAACSGAQAIDNPLGGELRAATGSDVFSEPSVHSYEVQSIAITQPDPMVYDSLDLPRLHGSGSMELSDGVITSATFELTTGLDQQTVAFELTEPLVLRREDTPKEPVDATGTLQVGEMQRYDTHLAVTPTFDGNGAAVLEVKFHVPDGLAAMHDASLQKLTGNVDTVTAQIVLQAEN